ncbi:hypothetical protein RCG24_02875 [Neobacillus sp. OS1-32]|uniref:hypothetical protein n=1 Tax=Neobacillus sp. OS1-32 TaxID=3070682 RepID=UPI0027E13F88|nr:hypothetical protein [Neobacillus sp. OS1-32]WML30865.1 hypothetical protein RCG24_02875 [Neobacillus sp. OS1-32]
METIQIGTKSKQYNVFLGEGVCKDIPAFLTAHFPNLTRVLIMTDETVAKLHIRQTPSAHEKVESSCVYSSKR